MSCTGNRPNVSPSPETPRFGFSDRIPSPAPSYHSMMSEDECEWDEAESTNKPVCSAVRVNLERSGSFETLHTEHDGTFSSLTTPRGMVIKPQLIQPEDAGASSHMDHMIPEPDHGHNTLELSFIFKSIQTTLENLQLHQFFLFTKSLNVHFPERFDVPMEDLDVLDVVDKMLERCGKGGALNVTLHILRNLKHNEVAGSLEKSCKRIKLQFDLRTTLKRRYDSIFEGIARQGRQTLLGCVHADVQMTCTSEAASGSSSFQEGDIRCSDIFKPSAARYDPVRFVLTQGIAGIGMTVCVQKFILEWAEETANEEIHFVFPIAFRQLNLIRDEKLSLTDLLCTFYPDVKEMDFIERKDANVLLIFDGLDCCHLPLNFKANPMWNDINVPTELDTLVTNLFQGNLLPYCKIWITSRSSATNWIPRECVSRVTELHGFNNAQKEVYFRKKFKEASQASEILALLSSTASLQIMCRVPMFCWVVAAVFERQFAKVGGDVTATFTNFYTHYMLLQVHMKNQKYYGRRDSTSRWLDTDKHLVVKLAQLAFQLLEKDSAFFCEEDLRGLHLDAKEVWMSGLCTTVSKGHRSGEGQLCFVHLSIQEYLAALHVHLAFVTKSKSAMDQPMNRVFPRLLKETSMFGLYRSAVDKAMQSSSGQFDLFLRFLLGLSLETTQDVLESLLTHTRSLPHNPDETASYIQKVILENGNSERCRNLTQCLNELVIKSDQIR